MNDGNRSAVRTMTNRQELICLAFKSLTLANRNEIEKGFACIIIKERASMSPATAAADGGASADDAYAA